jgi:hypothetical protein
MSKIIKKHIKPDKDKLGNQIVISVKEDNILIEINQLKGSSQVSLTYNQLCSLSRVIHKAIDVHYQEYNNNIALEKTEAIYFDDPIDW